MNTKSIEALLSFDPLAHAEDVTGASYKSDEATMALGVLLHMDHGKEKADALRLSADSYFNQPLPEFIAFLEGIGFVQILCDDIQETADERGNKYRIFWRDGVLVSFDSYWEDSRVNGGNAYLFYQGQRDAIFQGSSGMVRGTDDDPVWEVSFDVREGLRFRLDRLSDAGRILSQWPAERFLWLLHYRDTKQEGYDYKAISNARIAHLPEHVRLAITPRAA